MKLHRQLLVAMLLATAAFAAPRGKRQRVADVDIDMGKLSESLSELRAQINSLNLINGLNLDRDQMKQIVSLADRIDRKKQDYVRRHKRDYAEMEKAFKDLKNVLAKNGDLPEGLARRVAGIEHRVKRYRNAMAYELAAEAKKIETFLTPAQLEVVATFRPCILPPKNLRDPVRAGQASENERGEQILRSVRAMPDRVYRRMKERMISRNIQIAESLHARLSDAERKQERKRLGDLLDKVRSMSDADFELSKGELAEQLKPKNKMGDLIKQMQQAKPGGDTGKAARFLLSPSAVEILRARAKALR